MLPFLAYSTSRFEWSSLTSARRQAARLDHSTIGIAETLIGLIALNADLSAISVVSGSAIQMPLPSPL
ncbi:MAG: hypothetical protein AAB342_07110, partial [Chloroflexota bacterium]